MGPLVTGASGLVPASCGAPASGMPCAPAVPWGEPPPPPVPATVVPAAPAVPVPVPDPPLPPPAPATPAVVEPAVPVTGSDVSPAAPAVGPVEPAAPVLKFLMISTTSVLLWQAARPTKKRTVSVTKSARGVSATKRVMSNLQPGSPSPGLRVETENHQTTVAPTLKKFTA